jgi:hypothetical protein
LTYDFWRRRIIFSHLLQLKHSTLKWIYSSICIVNCCTSLNILSQNVHRFPSCLTVMCLSTPTRSSNKLSQPIHWRNATEHWDSRIHRPQRLQLMPSFLLQQSNHLE